MFTRICLPLLFASSLAFTTYNQTRFKREECGSETPFSLPSFQCQSGDCIAGDEECDGRVNCPDGSDETDNCKSLKCSRLLFQCEYGACIKKEYECDGYLDCQDGSDERHCKSITKCREGEFRCKNGQCIDPKYKCDGKAECDDFSDEIRETCFDKNCPGFLYKCKYGACAKGGAECNGVLECFDGSDEDPTLCGYKTGNPPPVVATGTEGKCILPEHPTNGHWSLFGGQSKSPGQQVDPGSILQIDCNKNYKLDGEKSLFCDNGKWSANVGTCFKICPARYSNPTTSVTCVYKSGEVENCTEAVSGTLARYECAPFYEDANLKTRPVHICTDGQWDQVKPLCLPVCGRKSVQATELIVNGKIAPIGDYPWQVALYTKEDKVLLCGGSILSQRLILTAAHCVTDEKGKAYSKENYQVAVGKYYRKFHDNRDKEAQISDIEEIFVASEYRGPTQNYLGDIAILVLKITLTLSRRVQPVCLDAGQNYNIREKQLGYVSGWGLTAETQSPSEVLKELRVPYISITECESKLPEDYEVFLTNDKMCAGYLEKGTSVCLGDSGGGLVFKHDGRYFITGVISLAPIAPTGGCNSNQYGLYTRVSNYINHFILPKLALYK